MRRLIHGVLLTVVLSLAQAPYLAWSALAAPAAPPRDAPLARILVRFADAAHRDAALRRSSAVARGAVGRTGFELLEVPALSARAAVDALAALPGVLDAEPDARVLVSFTPNDPYFQSDPVTGLGQWGLRKALVDRAWDLQRGSPSIVVATVDTGVDPTHPDLLGGLVAAPRFVSAPDASCPSDTTNRDDNGHGTHVAGIIGASAGNGVGIAGAAFGVRVMPIKALDCTGAGFLSDIATAITYAADNGARIINISLGSGEPSAALASAVTYALAKNVVVVAAAGNCGSQAGTARCPTLNATDYPAAYPGVVAVGATDAADQPTAFSTAASYVGISAPGVSIVSTFPTYRVQLNTEIAQNGYAALTGTSQAAPLVAAVAALVLSQDPSLTPAAVAQRLRATADDVGPAGYDTKSGDGRVNALRALTAPTTLRFGARYQVQSAPVTLTFATTASLRTTVTNTSSFTWPALGPDPVHVSTHWYAADGTLVAWDGPRASFAADVPPATSVTLDLPLSVPVPKGTYKLDVDVVQEGVTWFSAQGVPPLALSILVNGGYGATYVPSQATLALVTGTAPQPFAVSLTNTGTRPWSATGPAPVHLASHLRDANGKIVVWDGPRASLANDVAPGASVTVSLVPPAIAAIGAYTIELDLVQEGVTWFSSEGVPSVTLGASVLSGYGARYSVAAPPALLPGERFRLAAIVTNTGAFTWTAAGATPVRLASHLLDARGNVVVWDGARGTLGADVAPNASASTSLVIDAPLAAGTYDVRVDLVREGVAWFSTQGTAPVDLSLVVIAERHASATFTATSLSRAAPSIAVTVRNTGTAALVSDGVAPVDVSSHWLDANGAVLVWDGPRASLPQVLLPGDSATLTLRLAPPAAGATFLVVDLVQEGIAWFGAGIPGPVTLTP